MRLFYDKNDLPHSKKLRDQRFDWLKELGASDLEEAAAEEDGFLFGYENGEEQYRDLVENRPNIRDRPTERQELVRLDHVLARLQERGVDVPTPNLDHRDRRRSAHGPAVPRVRANAQVFLEERR